MFYRSYYRAVVLVLGLFCCSTEASDGEDLLLLIPSIISSSASGPQLPPTPSAQNLCNGFIVDDKSDRPMTALAKPLPGASYTDPVFGSKITRITNSNAISSGIIKTLYSTIQAWNADETRLILWHRGQGHYLYDGKSYALIEALEIDPADIEQVFWDTSNPDILYYPNQANGQQVNTAAGSVRLAGNELIEYNIETKLYRVIKDFNSTCTDERITAGNDVQMPAYDNDNFGLRCGDRALTYRVSTNTTNLLDGPAEFTAPQPLPSGQRIYHQGRVLDEQLKQLRQLDLGNVGEHSSLGRMHNGNDAYFAIAFSTNQRNSCGDGIGSAIVHDASNGSCRVLVGPSNGYPYSLSGTHLSALAHRNPGWAAVSSIGYGIEGDTLLEQELYLVNTDPSNLQVCRIAHHRATGRRGSIGYFAEPHPVISPSGTRVLFSSDWNNSGKVDVFVVELPAYQP